VEAINKNYCSLYDIVFEMLLIISTIIPHFLCLRRQ